MKDEIKEILELTIQFVEEELDKGTPKKDIIKAYSKQVGEAFNHIKDYITNLQEENERLKKYYNDNINKYEDLLLKYSTVRRWYDLCKSRNEKAIELLKEAGCYDEKTKMFCDDIWEELPKLLNILNGGDDNDRLE